MTLLPGYGETPVPEDEVGRAGARSSRGARWVDHQSRDL
jgi:hypothetical protein